MSRFLLLLVALMFTRTAVSGADYEVDCKLWKGDPKGSRKEGTQKLTSAPKMAMDSGEKGSLLIGGQFLVGGKLVPVGREISVVSSKEANGCVKVTVVLELHAVVGQGANRKVESKQEETTATVQLGEPVRVKIAGKDPKQSDWVEVTVRESK